MLAAVVPQRDADGKVDVKEHGGGLVAAGTGLAPSADQWLACSRPAAAGHGSRRRNRRGRR